MENRDVIVYQFGKVGSTSIVRTLDKLENINAYQSHFLGESMLREKLVQVLNPTLNPHFLKHGQGQLDTNITLTRLLNSYQQGVVKDRKLGVISLTREPLDWFRSQVAQELAGYLPGFFVLSGEAPENEGRAIWRALEMLKEAIKGVLEAGGGLGNPRFTQTLHAQLLPKIREEQPEAAEEIIRHVFAYLRPYVWFPTYFEPVLGVKVAEMQVDEAYYFYKETDWGQIFLFRYEELESGFTKMLKAFTGQSDVPLASENITADKKHANVIKDAFQLWEEDTEMMELTRGEYTQTFGY